MAISHDKNLERDAQGNLFEDDDLDDDEINDYVDEDIDANGMSDLYELTYGRCDNYPNVVEGKGWQHPFVYNARYAV